MSDHEKKLGKRDSLYAKTFPVFSNKIFLFENTGKVFAYNKSLLHVLFRMRICVDADGKKTLERKEKECVCVVKSLRLIRYVCKH